MLRRLIRQFGKRRAAAAAAKRGDALLERGELEGAIEAYRVAVAADGSDPVAHNRLGLALQRAGRPNDAAGSFRAALELAPRETGVRNNLGTALRIAGDLDGAAAEYDVAARQAPGDPLTRFNRAVLLQKSGLADEALRTLVELVRESPQQVEFHLGLAQALNYASAFDDPASREKFRASADAIVRGVEPLPRRAARAGDRLRVGYLSPDFRNHPVMRFMAPVLAAHDAGAVSVYCYDDTVRPDPWTRRLDSLPLTLRRVAGMSDAAVADCIAADELDLLVDLAGLTTGGRPRTIARRPARVQASYLGYLNTTGLAAMDWRITDRIADPPGDAECHYVERLAYLPGCQWLFAAPDEAPQCSAPPFASNGWVTLGAAHNFAKVTPQVLALWAQAAASIPDCRVALAGVPEGSVRTRVQDAFSAVGIHPDRVNCAGGLPRADYFRFLASLDIALDAFPYAGGTTTCEALWMGVPVVSLAGQHGSARSGASLLHAAGLPDCVAESPEQYASICRGLAADGARLARLRGELRARLQASPLMDAARFTRGLEGLYREIAAT